MTTERAASSRLRDLWNKGRLIGQKRPLKPKDVWTRRTPHFRQGRAEVDPILRAPLSQSRFFSVVVEIVPPFEGAPPHQQNLWRRTCGRQ